MNEHLNNSVILPAWLDHIIFNELGAVYNPDHFKFSYNLDHTKNDILVYLGTYFPRSYAEAYIIMCDLLANEAIRSVYAAKNSISILDLGCGTGGEIIGAICAFADILGSDRTFKVVAIDGNQNAIDMFEHMRFKVENIRGLSIKSDICPFPIENAEDMALLGDVIEERYDIILSFKAVNEFIQRKRFPQNAYKHFCEILAPFLAKKGFLVMLDVTTKNDVSGLYYPVMMNNGVNDFLRDNTAFTTLLPIPCFLKNSECNELCYMQQRFYVSHSSRVCDLSKVSYRVIGFKDFISTLHLIRQEPDVSYVVNANGDVCCKYFSGGKKKNGFKINS